MPKRSSIRTLRGQQEAKIAKYLQMEEIEFPPFSGVVRHGYLQHAVDWEAEISVCDTTPTLVLR